MKKISFVAVMNHPKEGINDILKGLKRNFFIFNIVLSNGNLLMIIKEKSFKHISTKNLMMKLMLT